MNQEDTITLPYKCKTKVFQYECEVFGVIYRDHTTDRILLKTFINESDADNFLEAQKKIAKGIDYKELQRVTETFNNLAAKHRKGEHLTDLEVDEMLAAWDRKVELEKEGGLYSAGK